MRLGLTLCCLTLVVSPSLAQTRVDLPPRYTATRVGPPSTGPIDGPVESAQVGFTTALAVAPDGAIYLADYGGTIRRVASGVVTTVAGVYGRTGNNDGPAAQATFGSIVGLAVTADGTVLIADSTNHTIRRLSPAGEVTTWLGAPGVSGLANGRGTAARFSALRGIALGGDGTAYVIDGQCDVRRVTPTGEVQPFVTVSGVCHASSSFPYRDPIYFGPTAIAVAPDGTVFVTRQWGGVVRITPGGVQTTLAATPERHLTGIVVTPGGVVRVLEGFVYDYRYGNNASLFGQNAVLDIATDGTVTVVATLDPRTGGSGRPPVGIAVDADGNTYVGNQERARIDRIAADGTVSPWVGTSPRARQVWRATEGADLTSLVVVEGDGFSSSANDLRVMAADGTRGPVLYSAGQLPTGVVRLGADLYFDQGRTIHRRTPDGVVTTIASFASIDFTVQELVAAPDGSLIARLWDVAPQTLWRIVRVATSGVVTTLASGSGYVGGVTVEADTGLVLYSRDQAIYRLEPNGTSTVLVGDPAAARALVDGAAATARLVNVTILRSLPGGGLLFVDGFPSGLNYYSERVLRYRDPQGVVTSLWASASGIVSDVVVHDLSAVHVVAGGDVYRLQPAPTASLVVSSHPQSATAVAGGTVSFSVAANGGPAPLVIWQESRDHGATWTTMLDADRHAVTGATLWRHAVSRAMDGYRYRAALADADEFLVSDAATLSVSGLGVSPAALRFRAKRDPDTGVLTAVTPPQAVTITISGVSTAWTASTSAGWLQVSATSGAGAGQLRVSIVNPGDLIGTASSLSGSVMIVPADPALLPIPILVSVTVSPSTPTAGGHPIGLVDTPIPGTAGLQGAIAMTGWALDDLGVQHVRIYRQCANSDAPGACQVILGEGMVLLGEASLIPGARPDVEAAYPTAPAGHTAGWGLLILSNLLPNLTTGASAGGVGAFTLFAVATDVEGQQTLLGRTLDDHTPTGVQVANDTIAKPFGAIDTPAQGATVSGIVNNFGWVLTPDVNTVADAGDVVMAPSGAGIEVFIDGLRLGTATYNLCRGTVGNPVPSGVLCDDDVSSIFRGGGRHRNLDAGRGAIGWRAIDTTTLSNGLHTIQWGVTDSAGRAEGIGARYFTVVNSGADQSGEMARWRDDEMAPRLADARSGQASSGTSALRHSGTSAPRHSGTPAPRHSGTSVYARTGFDLSRAFTPLVTDADGVAQVRIPELGRVEMQLPGVISGALLVHGEERPLPIGVGIDVDNGVVTWAPGVGFLGRYQLVLRVPQVLQVLQVHDEVRVDVTVVPAQLMADAGVRMHLDRAEPQCPVGSLAHCSISIAGWALDTGASSGAGIGAVHVWAKRVLGSDGSYRSYGSREPVFLGVAQLGVARPDVAAAHGAQYPDAGFTWAGALPEAGTWEITAYVWSWRTGRFEDARTVTIVVK